jgi:hypothetical protein
MKQLVKAIQKYKRLLIAFSPLLAIPIMVGAPAAYASSSIDDFCDLNDYCWYATGSGQQVNLKLGQNGTNDITYSTSTACGSAGKVTLTCPFADPVLDGQLEGHSIMTMKFIHANACADSNSSLQLVTSDCNGSHAEYVPVATGIEFISVGAANYLYNNNNFNDIRYIAGINGRGMMLEPLTAPNYYFIWTIYPV